MNQGLDSNVMIGHSLSSEFTYYIALSGDTKVQLETVGLCLVVVWLDWSEVRVPFRKKYSSSLDESLLPKSYLPLISEVFSYLNVANWPLADGEQWEFTVVLNPIQTCVDCKPIRLNGLLFSQNQFVVTGNSQAVFVAVMFNDDFILSIEQLFTIKFSFTAGRFRRADSGGRRVVSGVVHGNLFQG